MAYTSTPSLASGRELQPLDVPFILRQEELDFLHLATSIENEGELEEHVKKIQLEGYSSIVPYPCIRSFNFCRFKISAHPAWPRLLSTAQNSNHFGFLVDLGCCFGTDVRKCIVDGWPRDQILGVELEPEFINLGERLFKDESPPAFLIGDIFDPKFFNTDAPQLPAISTNAENVKNLTQLKGCATHIHAGSFFHLFDEATQKKLADIVVDLISHTPGSTVFGSHVSQEVSGFRGTEESERRMYCFNSADWNEMMVQSFKKKGVEVTAKSDLVDKAVSNMAPGGSADGFSLLLWSVTVV